MKTVTSSLPATEPLDVGASARWIQLAVGVLCMMAISSPQYVWTLFTKPMLAQFGVDQLRLMTNNPRKIDAMTRLGITVTERVPLLVNRNAFNTGYLDTKQAKLGHMMTPPVLVVAEDGEL